MMLTSTERAQIKSLLQSPQWATFERVAELFIAGIKGQTCLRENEWETLKATVTREAEESGVRRLIQELYKEAGNQT